MINKVVFLLLSEFILLWLQLQSGSLGWPLPLALMGALYLTMAYGRSWGIAGGLLSGMTLAVLYGNSWNLLYILLYPLLSCWLDWWVQHHEDALARDFWLPGVCAALVGAVPMLAMMFSSGNMPDKWLTAVLDLFWSAAVSAGIFMLILLSGEALGEFLGLPCFFNRKRRMQ